MAMNPGRTVAAVALTAGAISAGLFAGWKLRQRRWRHDLPYDIHEALVHRKGNATGTDDYEPVGI
jgi:hypothetical protein